MTDMNETNRADANLIVAQDLLLALRNERMANGAKAPELVRILDIMQRVGNARIELEGTY